METLTVKLRVLEGKFAERVLTSYYLSVWLPPSCLSLTDIVFCN